MELECATLSPKLIVVTSKPAYTRSYTLGLDAKNCQHRMDYAKGLVYDLRELQFKLVYIISVRVAGKPVRKFSEEAIRVCVITAVH